MNPLIELDQLCSLFPEPEAEPLYTSAEHIAREATPEPYHRMLVHEHHMTVTMESYHDCSVEVVVVDSKYVGDLYCRKILLKKDGTDQNVRFGIVRFNFGFVTDSVREQIESEDTALAAKQLKNGDLPEDSAVIANENCAKLFNLTLLAEGINDLKDNQTLFIVASTFKESE